MGDKNKKLSGRESQRPKGKSYKNSCLEWQRVTKKQAGLIN
jgi:hypothetical protein